jgi:formylglycine-generating enzyme required for sulfatase activity
MTKFALLIGVSEYGLGLSPLPSPVEDVEALRRVLVNPERGDFLAQNINVLKNPDRQEMEGAIYALFDHRQKDDVLLFYFSGHGIKDERDKLYLGTRITEKNDRGSLVTPTAVAATYLHEQIESSKSQRQVIILDACFSGAIAQGMTVKDDGKVRLDNYLGGKGRAILTSSTATEYSFGAESTEEGSIGLSLYTRYLVEGIETGAADLDGNDRITAEELHRYAYEKVKQAAPSMTPEIYPVKEGYEIELSKSRSDTPNLKYEREVIRLVAQGQGELSPIVRRLLLKKQQEWVVLAEDAKEIEDRVLQPYREYQRKLADYEQILTEAVQNNYPLSDREQADLKEWQQHYKLADEDIAKIHQRVLPDRTPKLSFIEFTSPKIDAQGNITERHQGKAEVVVEDLGNGVSLTMLKIPGGEFLIGSPTTEKDRFSDESPQSQVRVSEFYLGKTLVTQAQWQQIMGNNPSKFTGNGKLPVERVSWLDTQKFCQKLCQRTQQIYRLPSEAEWEYACRAGTTTPFHFGGTITGNLAKYDSNLIYGQEAKVKQPKKTTPVSNFPPNAFGLYDMHGNLWEWCLDEWSDLYQNAPSDGSAWLSHEDSANRILRGGSWIDPPRNCRSATRDKYSPSNSRNIIGFRVVREIQRTL